MAINEKKIISQEGFSIMKLNEKKIRTIIRKAIFEVRQNKVKNWTDDDELLQFVEDNRDNLLAAYDDGQYDVMHDENDDGRALHVAGTQRVEIELANYFISCSEDEIKAMAKSVANHIRNTRLR